MVKHRILLGVFALAICTGTAWGTSNSLAITAGSGTLTCNTSTGPTGTVTLTIKGATGATYPISSIAVNTTTGLQAGTPSGTSLAASTNSITVVVQPNNDCSGFTGTYSSGAATFAASIQFKVGATPDASQNVNIALTDTAATPLSVSPSPVAISCVLNPGGSTSGGTATFTLNTSATAYIGPTTSVTRGSAASFAFGSGSSWLTLTNVAQSWTATSSSSATALNVASAGGVVVTATAACAQLGALGNSKTAALTLITAAPEPSTVTLPISITVTVVGPAPLSVTGTAPNGSAANSSLALGSYTRSSENFPSTTVHLTALNPVYFMVDMTTMPSWLTVSAGSGQITTGGGAATLSFTVTKVADMLPPGVYTTGGTTGTCPAGNTCVNSPAIALKVAGYQSTYVYLTLTVQTTAPTLTVQGGSTQNLSWSLGQPLPTATITVLSSGAPIPFTTVITPGATDAGALVNPVAGLAYSFGTPIAVSFNAVNFAGAAPGSALTSRVDINWLNGSTPVATSVNFIVNIQAPSTTATLTGISPQYLPSGAAGQTFAVTLYGSGFVASNLSTQATFLGVVGSGGTFQKDANIVATVNSATMISLVITVPTGTDTLLPFGTPGSTVTLGACNPNGNGGNPPCNTPSTIPLYIANGPVISAVTSGSTFEAVTSTSTIGLAPYDIVSIFGSNFCVSGGTGCSATQVLNSAIVNGAYQNFASPDVAGSTGQRLLQVFFCTGASTSATLLISNTCFAAPLLFATNSQINAVVPGEAKAATSASWNVYVRFAAAAISTTTAGSAGVSLPASYNAAANDAGVFIVDSSDDGAIVVAGTPLQLGGTVPNAGQVAYSAAQAARLRLAQANSDTVSIFMSGLGVPPTVAVTGCMTVSGYATNASLTSSNPALDGVILDSGNYSGGATLPPCFVNGATGTSPITLSIGGMTVVPNYVGWAPSEVAGLYQVNVPLLAYGAGLATAGASPVTLSVTSGPLEVPVVVSVGGNPTGQAINMWVQPAMTLAAAGSATAPVSLSLGVYSVTATNLATAGPGVAAIPIDTVSATGNGTATFAIYSDSLEGTITTSSTYFSVVAGVVSFIHPIAQTGTYTVTIQATDPGNMPTAPALPVEYLTLTITVD